MEKRYQVFISSTFNDLQEERQRISQTLIKYGHIPAGMELFPAMDEEQFEFIKRIIDNSDYYLLIVGGRYGSLAEDGISYTEKEYDYAIEKKLKVIALLHKNPDQIAFNKSEQKSKLREKLEAFRKKVSKTRLINYWTNIDELEKICIHSLFETIRLYPAIGWVRSGKISNEELLTEINELRKENIELKQELDETKSDIFLPSEEKDFSFIFNKLNRLEDVQLDFTKKEDSKLIRKHYSINLGSLLPFLSAQDKHEYSLSSLKELISKDIKALILKDIVDLSISLWEITVIDFGNELLTYSFVTRETISKNTFKIGIITTKLIYSEKLERYKYWLTVNNKMPERIEIYEK